MANISESERILQIFIYQMGGNASGALNATGFAESIRSKQLPSHTHITHNGIYNEQYFSIGPRAHKLLQLQNGLALSNCHLHDLPTRNQFLSLFLKSSTDGQQRTRPLNLVVALDVSGSMDGALTSGNPYLPEGPVEPPKSRLALSREAILLLFSKLKPDDVFGLITFHTTAKTIIQSSFVRDLDRDIVTQLVNSKFESGGTTISAGFKEAMDNINKFKHIKELPKNYENRIVLLTDVGDNSVAGEEKLIQQISDAGVSTTIIGVSSDFRSETCEKLIKVRGFNYMCAVNNSDLQTYLVDQFDYTFFPCVQNVTISITSEDVQDIQVYGSVDHDVRYSPEGDRFTVTKMTTGFPSALNISKTGETETKGGLILVQLKPKKEEGLPKIKLGVHLSYSDMEGEEFQQVYNLQQSVEAEQYYSSEAVRKGVNLFYYTETIRHLLKDMKEGEKQLSDSNKGQYLGELAKLKDYCPPDKQEELANLIDIVEKKEDVVDKKS